MAFQRMGRERQTPVIEGEPIFEDHVVKIYRCACVVKGGRRFSFAALVVVGDRSGRIGVGYGKAKAVPMSVEKGVKDARKNMVKIALKGGTIPHQVEGRFGASKVVLVPAGEGTGVIAGKNIRPMLELTGIKDILTKSHGSSAAKNLVKATLDGLMKLRSADMVSRLRGVEVES